MTKKIPSQTLADLGLVTVTIFWGSTFILSKMVLEEVPLVIYLSIRLNLAAIMLALYAFRFRNEFTLRTLYHGIIMGVFLFLSYLFKNWGIQNTSATKDGFKNGLKVVFLKIFCACLTKIFESGYRALICVSNNFLAFAFFAPLAA